MSLLEWKDEYLLGIDALDHEHKDLFDSVNEVYAQCSRRADFDTVDDCLSRLHARLAAHFALEERTMRDMKNPHYADHKAEHDRFLDVVTAVLADFGDDFSHEAIDTLARQVQDWIVGHITTYDRQLVER
ncbi:MAG: bacteriohemerythrin, partial [Gammaproteobacteria bacterium]|nr:bacteriohemerythrin [Gammaproteobacteria bacterium]